MVFFSIAMSLRRPNTMPYNSWVRDCLAVLNSTATTHIGDRRLVAWIHLQKLAEETLAMAGIDGSSSGRSQDSRTHLNLKSGLERVKAWRHTVSDDIMHGSFSSILPSFLIFPMKFHAYADRHS